MGSGQCSWVGTMGVEPLTAVVLPVSGFNPLSDALNSGRFRLCNHSSLIRLSTEPEPVRIDLSLKGLDDIRTFRPVQVFESSLKKHPL